MSVTVIADVGNTLVTLLRNNTNLPAAQIALLSPVDAEGQDIRLTLFLYDILETPELKNADRIIVSPTQSRPAPLSLNLYYLLTAHPPPGLADPTQQTLETHRNLGRAMRVFCDSGILAGTVLQGALAGTGAELRLTLNPMSVEDMTRIWSVFPNSNYRPSVTYLVTPASIDSDQLFDEQRVVEKRVDFDHVVPTRQGA
jgi:hypothetical protein